MDFRFGRRPPFGKTEIKFNFKLTLEGNGILIPVMKSVSFQTEVQINGRCATLSSRNFPIYSIASVSQQSHDSYTLYVGGGGGTSKTGIPNGFTSMAISSESGIPLNAEEAPFCSTKDTVLGLRSISDTEFLVAVGDKVVKAIKDSGEFHITNPKSESFSLADDDFIRLVKRIDADKFFVLYASGQIFSYINDKYESISDQFQLESMSDIKSIDAFQQLIAITTSTFVHIFTFSVDAKNGSINIMADKRQTVKADAIKSIKIRSFWYVYSFSC